MCDALIASCPLSYTYDGKFIVDCDMNTAMDVVDPLQFESWMVELVALCGTRLHAIHYHAQDGVRTVYY